MNMDLHLVLRPTWAWRCMSRFRCMDPVSFRMVAVLPRLRWGKSGEGRSSDSTAVATRELSQSVTTILKPDISQPFLKSPFTQRAITSYLLGTWTDFYQREPSVLPDEPLSRSAMECLLLNVPQLLPLDPVEAEVDHGWSNTDVQNFGDVAGLEPTGESSSTPSDICRWRKLTTAQKLLPSSSQRSRSPHLACTIPCARFSSTSYWKQTMMP